MICFDTFELKSLFETPSRERLVKEISNSGYSPSELLDNKFEMQKIIDKIKIISNKEDKEIFCAIYLFSKFYSENSKICFLLKNGTDAKSILSLDNLTESIKEGSEVDFLMWSDDGQRAFQLKAYYGKNDIDSFFQFLEVKLRHYGNDLTGVNLLINMQSEGEITNDLFHELHERLKNLLLRGEGHILISYNENNKVHVINTIYPILATTRIPHEGIGLI